MKLENDVLHVEVARLRRKLAEAVAVLEPFTNAPGGALPGQDTDTGDADDAPLDGYWGDILNLGPNKLTYGHLRAARRWRESAK
jgi:hypothetical protein